ncbi:hypothetical protein ACIQNG_03235 [Streptomyces sp. NPDC091377]|uniref:hypothetical protein n=1 Tax=Streptomyces sp. NPDC091377 TaxID=3365995 RepID=UPI003809F8B7
MTRSLIRGRPKRAKAHISARLAQSVLGGVIAVLWLCLALPGAHHAPPGAGPGPLARDEGTSTADLALPLIAGVAAVSAGTYGYVRRTRRTRSRTTPGAALPATAAGPPATAPSRLLDAEAAAALVEADDCVRTSREELDFATAGWDRATAEPFVKALRHAGTELAAAFAIRERYDDGLPEEETARRQALTGIAGRCGEAGRLLDAEAAGLDAARALETRLAPALEVAEARFRELTARVTPAEAALTDLARVHSPGATAPVTGFVEQARDRLVFAALRLNEARQRSDLGESERAAARLRAAEGATAQAAVLLDAVDGHAADLRTAESLLPAALTGAESELTAARERTATDLPPGELRARVGHADTVLAVVRKNLTAGTAQDPLALLRGVVRAVVPAADGHSGVLPSAAELLARNALAGADAYVSTHRAAVSARPRTLLASAFRLLATDRPACEEAARRARDLAERDVLSHGNPYPDPADHTAGVAGAVLGGLLLNHTPDADPPASYGGPRTRARRTPPTP